MASQPTRRHLRVDRLSRTCRTLKIGYGTRGEALDACEAQMAAGLVWPGCHVMPYACDACGRWHTRNQRIVFTEPPVNLARGDHRRRGPTGPGGGSHGPD